jgi:hypothetical protein
MFKCIYIFLALLLFAAPLSAQPPSQRKYVASKAQMDAIAFPIPPKLELEDPSLLRATPLHEDGKPTEISKTGRSNAVNPIGLGQSANVFTCVSTTQNQVFASDSIGSVGFVHRSDPGTWGGSSGILRYDISVDGGQTFTNDIGPINPIATWPARYPNAAFAYQPGDYNPFNAFVHGCSPTINAGPSFGGRVNTQSSVATGTPTTLEDYDINSPGASPFLGFTIAGGKYLWYVTSEQSLLNASKDTVMVYCKQWSLFGILIYSRYDYIVLDQTAYSTPNLGSGISFTPDGTQAWIGLLSDTPNGHDSILSPIFIHSADSGQTWGPPIEVNLNSIPWVADSLRSLWVDSAGNPASSGIATTAFDFDLTVDRWGNPHMAVVVGTASPDSAYGFQSGLAKFLMDVTTTDGGATWQGKYIAPILTVRGDFGSGPNGSIAMDNQPQISRSEDGETIFFSWVDSDTSQFTGYMSGVGFGTFANLAPNLRVAGYRPGQNTQTYPKLVTDGDLIWAGRALFPTMAPTVLTSSGIYSLPIVMAELINNDPYSTSKFWYFGNDAVFVSQDFCDSDQIPLGWTSFAEPGFPASCEVSNAAPRKNTMQLGIPYPNPSTTSVAITFELPQDTKVQLEVHDLMGHRVAIVVDGDYKAGAHQLQVNTEDLPQGIYLITLAAEGQQLTQKFAVVH